MFNDKFPVSSFSYDDKYLKLTILDPESESVKSGMFAERITATIKEKQYELCMLAKNGDDITATF